MLMCLILVPLAVRYELLALALIGTISSTVFLALVLVAVQRFRSGGAASTAPAEQLPPVTILKPICGLEPQLEQNLASFFELDYPDYEIIFGCRTRTIPPWTWFPPYVRSIPMFRYGSFVPGTRLGRTQRFFHSTG